VVLIIVMILFSGDETLKIEIQFSSSQISREEISDANILRLCKNLFRANVSRRLAGRLAAEPMKLTDIECRSHATG